MTNHCIVVDIVYDIVCDIAYDIIHDITHDIFFSNVYLVFFLPFDTCLWLQWEARTMIFRSCPNRMPGDLWHVYLSWKTSWWILQILLRRLGGAWACTILAWHLSLRKSTLWSKSPFIFALQTGRFACVKPFISFAAWMARRLLPPWYAAPVIAQCANVPKMSWIERT